MAESSNPRSRAKRVSLMRTSVWMPLSAKKAMAAITRLTTRVAAASSLVCRLNSAHQRASRCHQLRGAWVEVLLTEGEEAPAA